MSSVAFRDHGTVQSTILLAMRLRNSIATGCDFVILTFVP